MQKSIFDDRAHFGTISRIFHWVMAICMICLWGVGLSLSNHIIPHDAKRDVLNMHKSIGMLILLMAVIRVMWRLSNKTSPSSSTFPLFSKIFSELNKWFFYALMFAFPLSGIGATIFGGYPLAFFGISFVSPGTFKSPEWGKLAWETHELCGKLFILAFALHILGVLYHQFFLKDRLLNRMVGKS